MKTKAPNTKGKVPKSSLNSGGEVDQDKLNDDLLDFSSEGRVKEVSSLLSRGADPNYRKPGFGFWDMVRIFFLYYQSLFF